MTGNSQSGVTNMPNHGTGALSKADAATTDLAKVDLEAVVEIQTVELDRLLRDNKRLNRRIDYLIEEVGSLRKLQAREQDLREKEHSLRERDQALHQEAQESMLGLVERAMILPNKRDQGAKGTQALADIHRHEPQDPDALRARYTDADAQQRQETAWPDIPTFLRRD